MRSRISTVLLPASQATFSIAMACCTSRIISANCWEPVTSGRGTAITTLGSCSMRFCGVSLTTRNRVSETGTRKDPVAASSPCSASR